MADELTRWDVFISHASEDKSFARPLAEKLRKLGLNVWFDEFELKVGDSLSRSIDKGLAKSDHGVVILSTAFFEKHWTEYEIRGLIANSLGTERRILPIWHNITRRDVLNFSPSLADVLAESTARPLDELALKLLSVLKPEHHSAVLRKLAYDKEVSDAESVKTIIAEIKRAPIRHLTLPADLEARVRLIQYALRHVYPLNIKEWMEGFQRDLHPQDEIAIWEKISARYLAAAQKISLSKRERRDVLRFLLALSTQDAQDATGVLANWKNGKRETVLKSMEPDETIFIHSGSGTNTADTVNLQSQATIFTQKVGADDRYLKELVSKLKFGASSRDR